MFIASQVPYGNGLTVSITGIVVAGIITAFIISVVGFFVKRFQTSLANIHKDAAHNGQAIVNLKESTDKALETIGDRVETLVAVLTTKAPSALDPRPVIGLVDAVMGKGGLIEVQNAQGLLLKANNDQLIEHGKQLEFLMKDAKPDCGGSTRDAIDRIDKRGEDEDRANGDKRTA